MRLTKVSATVFGWVQLLITCASWRFWGAAVANAVKVSVMKTEASMMTMGRTAVERGGAKGKGVRIKERLYKL